MYVAHTCDIWVILSYSALMFSTLVISEVRVLTACSCCTIVLFPYFYSLDASMDQWDVKGAHTCMSFGKMKNLYKISASPLLDPYVLGVCYDLTPTGNQYKKICMIIIALRAHLMVYDLKTSPLRPILVCPFFADSLYLPVSAVVTNTLPKILYPEFLQEQAVLVFHYDHSKRITCPLLSCPQVFLQLFHINT